MTLARAGSGRWSLPSESRSTDQQTLAKSKWLNPKQMLASLPQNASLACYQCSSEAHGVYLQSYRPKYAPTYKRFLTTENSPKTKGFASRGCCADSALNPQALPSPAAPAGSLCRPACQAVFFIPKSEVEMLRLQKAKGWQPVPCPSQAAPRLSRDGQAPPRESLQSIKGSFPPPRADLKLFLCVAFLSPHQSHSCCTSAWGLDGSHPAMLLPPKYLLALLQCFAVVFPSAPNYTKTIY